MKYELTSHEFNDKDTADIVSLFASQMLTMGKEVASFEEKFAAFHGRKYAVMANSGSSANLLMVASLVLSGMLERGSKVGVPAVSWSTTYFPLAQYGLVPVFIDVDSETLSLNEHGVLRLIREFDVDCILNVPLLGNYSNSSCIKRICEENNVILIEDCCEAFGSSFEGNCAGGTGVASTHSFFYSHQLPAIEGGAVLFDDKNLYDHALALRAHGWTRDITSPTTLPIDNDEFTRSFRFVLPGYCLRPMEINAVLARNQLARWESRNITRMKNHKTFVESFSGIKGINIQQSHEGMSAFGFGCIIDKEINRKQLTIALSEAGIVSRPIVAGNFLNNPVIKYMPHLKCGDFNVSDHIDNQGFFLGNHSKDLTAEIIYASEIIQREISRSF